MELATGLQPSCNPVAGHVWLGIGRAEEFLGGEGGEGAGLGVGEVADVSGGEGSLGFEDEFGPLEAGGVEDTSGADVFEFAGEGAGGGTDALDGVGL